MKKVLKILLIVILVLIICLVGYYSYLKIQIKKEENRLEKEESQLMQLNTELKYLVEISYNDGLATGYGMHKELYEIDFETKTIINKIEEAPYQGTAYSNFILQETQHLEYLKGTKKGQIISSKTLTDEDANELKQLLDDIINNKVERMGKEEQNTGTIDINLGTFTYKITTKDNKNIRFDNKDLVNKFLSLVK